MAEHESAGATGATAAQLMETTFEAIGERDLEALAAVWDEHSVDVFFALQLEVVGEADLRAFFGEMFAAMPDLRFVVEEIHEVSDDVAVGQWHLTGTFSGGPFQGIEPTGRRVDLRGIDVMRFDGDRLRRNDVYYDGLSFARQVGLLPAADSPADRGMLAAFNALTQTRQAVRSWFGR